MLAHKFYDHIPYPIFEKPDCDLRKLSQDQVKEIIDAYNNHQIIIIRNQTLNERELIEVSKLFGEPAQALVPTFRLSDYPLITRHTNTKDSKNKNTGVMAPEFIFHADSYFTANPTKATLFYCLKAPNVGGETHLVNMCDVYDSLDETTKKLICDKFVDYKNAFINQPPVSHPMVRLHPITNKKALFVNKHKALGISELSEENATKLATELYHYATSQKFVYKHKWQTGDLVIWNNVTTMHAATPIADTEERLLYRVLTKGDLPVK